MIRTLVKRGELRSDSGNVKEISHAFEEERFEGKKERSASEADDRYKWSFAKSDDIRRCCEH